MKIKIFNKSGENTLDDLYFSVDYDEFYQEDEYRKPEDVKIEIRQNRRYNFLHDFWLDWSLLDIDDCTEEDYYYPARKYEQERLGKIKSEYYVFGLDFFDHSVIAFSLTAERQNIGYYEFDRSRDVWIIAVKKAEDIDEERAFDIAKETIENYNSIINGWIYAWKLEQNDEFIDGCTGFYSEENAVNDWKNFIEYYLQKAWIDFTKYELVGN
jgi:hypothetical protein